MSTVILMFGSLRLKIGNYFEPVNGAKLTALTALLALETGPQYRDKLATVLWEDTSQKNSRMRLRQLLQRLRTTFKDEHIDTTRDTVAFNFSRQFTTDVHQFLAIANLAESQSVDELTQAVQLYKDDLLAGFTLPNSPLFDEWYQQKRAMLQRQLEKVYTQLITLYQDQSQIEKALHYANELVNKMPWKEANHKLLMQLHVANDNVPAAINQYHTCRHILKEELGIEPGEAINSLYKRLLSSSTALSATLEKPTIKVGRFPPRPPLVVGRDADVYALRTCIQSQKKSHLVIQGWPGIGKSTLLARLAHDNVIQDYFRDGILWTALGEVPDLKYELDQLIRSVLPDHHQPGQSVAQARDILHQLLHERNILLIIDDVWDIAHIQWFRVIGERGMLITSTRFNDVTRQIASSPDEIYKLGILSDETAYTLLAQLAPDVVAQYPNQVRQLIADLEGLPLALQVAGRLLQAELDMGWGIDDLLIALRQGDKLLQARAPIDRIDNENGTLPTVATLLKQSTDRLTEDMRLKFATLGLLAPKPATFDVETISAMWDTDNPREGIRALVDRGLLEPVGNGRFQMHALLVTHARLMFDVP